MKRLIINGFLSALAVFSAHGQITFSVTGTANANGTNLGYSVGQTATFYFTVNPGYTGENGYNDFVESPGDEYEEATNSWVEEDTGHDLLFSGVGGTGLSGTWTRPVADAADAFSRLQVVNSFEGGYDTLTLLAANDRRGDPWNSFIGLTANGLNVVEIEAYRLELAGFDFAYDGDTISPVDYFSSRLGTYTITDGSLGIVAKNGSGYLSSGFNLTSLTISEGAVSAVPEPSTYAVLLGGVVLSAAAMRRRGRSSASAGLV